MQLEAMLVIGIEYANHYAAALSRTLIRYIWRINVHSIIIWSIYKHLPQYAPNITNVPNA